jgi:putative peptide zinc metalloprotease protein
MEQTYLSPSWYRVSNLKLRLRSHARIHRSSFRGQVWYVLQDRTSGRFHRFAPETYLVISLMDGVRTMEQVWDLACNQLKDKVLTQDEFIQLLGQLHSADVLSGDVPPDIEELSARSTRQRNRKLLMKFINPLAIRFGLLDPDEFLAATMPLIRPLFSIFGAIFFVAVLGYAAALAAMNWAELTENVTGNALAVGNIALLLMAYPFIKALHELGHAYAIKRWGGEVHEIGIMLLVFMPVPYVDASDSLAFQNKWHRALVGGAGILVEMLLASLALIVWVNAEEGLVRAFAFNVMLIGGVSTLLFNGNPLLKFDGYYVLSDLAEIPNLASRSNQYLGYLIKRYAFGLQSATSPVTALGEPAWFVVYSISGFCYRLMLTAAIVTIVATHFFIVGTIIACWAIILMIGVPLAKHTHFLLANPSLRHKRARAFGVVGGALAIVAFALFALPLPYSTTAEGVVWIPGGGVVHAGSEGVVSAVLATPDSFVAAGAPLVRLDDPLVTARLELMGLRVKELELRLGKQDMGDLANARIVREELRHARADYQLALARQEALTIRAASSGTLILPNASDLVGRYVRRGEVLAYVAQFDAPLIRVIVPEDDADLVRSETSDVSVRFAAAPSMVYAAEVEREIPALTATLPNNALSTAGGGQIALDPRDSNQRRVLANLLHIDIRLSESRETSSIGGRVYVRFFHGAEPLASRLYRSIRQIFLKTFQV